MEEHKKPLLSPMLVVVLVLAVVLVVFSVIMYLTEPAPQAPSKPTEVQTTVPSEHAVESEARKISRTVKASLDTTTLEQFMIQMPDILATRSISGDKRIFTWTFSDGSKIVATFQPAGGPGTGLVLHMVDIRD